MSGSLLNVISGMSGPEGIAVSGSDLFVANQGNGTVGEFTTSGTVVNASLISGLNSPNDIAIVDTPEPSALALLAAGAIGLAAYLWRRRQKRSSLAGDSTPGQDEAEGSAIISMPSRWTESARRAA